MVAPGGEDGGLESALGGFGEEDAGAALAAPGSVDGLEGGGMGCDEFFLLCGSELDHTTFFVWIAQSGEDFAGDAEVGMVHVPALLGLREREGKAAEVGGPRWHGNREYLSTNWLGETTAHPVWLNSTR